MKVELTVRREVKELVDVEFPIYRQHDVGGDNYHSIINTRITEDMKAVSVKHSGSFVRGTQTYEVEFTSHYVFGNDSLDFQLGRGEYEGSKKEFDDALAQAIKELSAVV